MMILRRCERISPGDRISSISSQSGLNPDSFALDHRTWQGFGSPSPGRWFQGSGTPDGRIPPRHV
ncbi:hypothetical protein ATKI12_1494 [Kitasatospora sp. Ki12]